MKVLKFGGTSVGSCEQIQRVIEIASQDTSKKILVLSAMSGTTDQLVKMANLLEEGRTVAAQDIFSALLYKYEDVLDKLFYTSKYKTEALTSLSQFRQDGLHLIRSDYTASVKKKMVVQGEFILTRLFHLACQQEGVRSKWLSALDYVKVDHLGQPDIAYTQRKLNEIIHKTDGFPLYILQGFVCRNYLGEVDNLGRGGSDYTATIVGAAVKAQEVQIWTDIDGIHNIDPRHVNHSKSINQLHYSDASMLASYGAKVLHPASVKPLVNHHIPLRIKNTFAPTDAGTLINWHKQEQSPSAVSVKDKMKLIIIEPEQVNALNESALKIFEIFQEHDLEVEMLSIDKLTVNVVTAAQTEVLKSLVEDLKAIGATFVKSGFTIVNVVGDFKVQTVTSLDHIFRTIKEIPIKLSIHKMDNNSYLLLLIESNHKEDVLNILSQEILGNLPLVSIEERA